MRTAATNRPLKNVGEAGKTRQKQARKRSLRAVNEHSEPVFNAVLPTQVVFQRPAKPSGTNAALARAAYLLAVLIGSYGVIWTLTECIAVALSRLGLERGEAVIASTLLGFVLYPALALLAFAAQRPLRLWAVLMAASVLFGLVSRGWGAG